MGEQTNTEKASMFSELELFRVQNIVNEAIASLKRLVNDRPTISYSKEIKAIIRLLDNCHKNALSTTTSYLNDEIIERDFYKRLLEDYPTFTICERRLCLLTLLHLSSKEVSEITRQSVDAINKTRIRLRKKLGLTGSKTTLLRFLDQYRG